ncbi:hypothetical protein DRQ23_03115 [bacterium]|nr:MAG: hypothetical protein DRQ23_03115 [bacterium]
MKKEDIFDAWGFPPGKGDIHREITREALIPLGFDRSTIDFLARVGRFQDIRFHVGPLYLGAPSPSHFERSWVVRNGNPELHLKAFEGGRRFLVYCVRNIVSSLGAYPESVDRISRNKKAMLNFGRALHTLQDFFSHSNYIDLNKDQREKVSYTLFHPEVAPPDYIRIVYVGLHFFIDHYPHGAFGFGETKDNPSWTKGGKERFLRAKMEAVEHTREFVLKLFDGTLYRRYVLQEIL